MRAKGEQGALVTLMCDSGERYPDSYYDESWVARQFGDISGWQRELE